jgi:hypothetical protein
MAYDAINHLTGKTYSSGMSPVSYSYDSGLYGKGQRTGLADGSVFANIHRLYGENSGRTMVTNEALGDYLQI